MNTRHFYFPTICPPTTGTPCNFAAVDNYLLAEAMTANNIRSTQARCNKVHPTEEERIRHLQDHFDPTLMGALFLAEKFISLRQPLVLA